MKVRRLLKSLLSLGASVIALCLLLKGASTVASSSEGGVVPEGRPPASRDAHATPSVIDLSAGDRGGCNRWPAIAPDQFILEGEVTTRANCVDATVCSWLENTPTGTIMLGVDPASPDPADWAGGSATLVIGEHGISFPWMAELIASWPDMGGKGIHSPQSGVTATIELNGQPLWVKRALHRGAYGHYYAVQSPPAALNFRIEEPMPYSMTFRVPAHTAWDLSEVQLNLCTPHVQARGYGYSPFHHGQAPQSLQGRDLATEDQIWADISLLAQSANEIRTYGACGVQAWIPELAEEHRLSVAVGAWLDRDQTSNEREIDCAVDAASRYTYVGSVVVGSEVLLRGDMSEVRLIDTIYQVKEEVFVPVTTAETWDVLRKHPAVVDAVDYVLVHIHPWWDAWHGATITDPVRYVVDTYHEVQRQAPGKRVVIGETGWPSDGETRGLAVPGLREQCQFYTGFLRAADQENIPFYLFEAFDQPWKAEPGGVGGHWGLHDAGGATKHKIQGVLWRGDPLNLDTLCTPPNDGIYLPMVRRE